MIVDYTVSYIDYGSEESKEAEKPVTQNAFAVKLYNSNAGLITQGKTEFYPLFGTSLNMRITAPDQNERDITIEVPPISLAYLSSDQTISHFALKKMPSNFLGMRPFYISLKLRENRALIQKR